MRGSVRFLNSCMTVISVGGVPASGKTSIMRQVIQGLASPEYVEPFPLFPCQRHGDVLVVGRYPTEEPWGGTDRLSYGAINKFADFIHQEYSNHRHIVLEGDRFFRVKDIEWLVSGYDTQVFVLQVSPEELKRRHIYRKDTQTTSWLKGRHTQIQNIMTNLFLMGHLQVRTNETSQDARDLVREIHDLLD